VKHAAGGARKPLLAVMALLAASLGVVPPATADPTDEDPSGPSADPDVVAGKKALDDKRWVDAIKALSSAALRDTRNADIQNYLGYAHRNAGQMDKAFAHYERALKLNPRHRGAHEYVGEAYLMVGKPAQAQEHLKALQAICLLPCEELDDLKAKIDRYQREAGKP
jgi:tetratricopeptide (TPR) repeat protein